MAVGAAETLAPVAHRLGLTKNVTIG